jgi:hypothetical protein
MLKRLSLAALFIATALPGFAAATHDHGDPRQDHHDHHGAPANGTVPDGIGTDAPPLVAEYSLRSRGTDGKWSAPVTLRFIRTADRLTTEQPDFSETWRRHGDTDFNFERAFHDERRIVEYTSGELRTLGIAPDWDMLRVALDRRTLGALDAGSHLRGKDGDLIRYRSTSSHGDIVLDWSARQQLPVRLERTRGKTLSELTLTRTLPYAPATLAAIDARLAGYQRIDASDFGDMESDPFIRKAERIDVLRGWRGSHGH